MGIANKFLSTITIVLMIVAILTGKLSLNQMGEEAATVGIIAIVSIFAIIKALLAYLAIALAISLSIFAIITDLVFNSNLLSSLWELAWTDIAVNWFWNGTNGIALVIGLTILGGLSFIGSKMEN